MKKNSRSKLHLQKITTIHDPVYLLQCGLYNYQLYQEYCKENGYKPFTHTNLGIHLKKNFERIAKKDGNYYKVEGLRVEGLKTVNVEKDLNIFYFEQQPKNNPQPSIPSTNNQSNIIKFKLEPDKNLIKQMEKDLNSGSDINEEAKLFINGKIPKIERWKHDNVGKAVGSLKIHGYTREQVEDIFNKYTDHILNLALLIYDTDYEEYQKEN
jgi:hypothetical protein